MKKSVANLLFSMIHDYLKIYLPKQRNLSDNTIGSYRVTLEQLVDYIQAQKKVPLHDVTFDMLTPEMITNFLDWLESDRSCSISTRNTRLAALRAFVKFAASRDISTVEIFAGLKKISSKKPNKSKTIEYMSMEAISAVVDVVDIEKKLGFRDKTFLILLYDTGARIQEIADSTLCDLRFGRTPTIIIHGKGNKDRSVPLMEKTAEYLKRFLTEYHADASLMSKRPLFYSIIHGEPYALTTRRLYNILSSYGKKAREQCKLIPKKVHPHLFRHSRAMHLYQNGMDLTLVSQWLGHSYLETTQIYAHADTEHKRSAISAATPPESPLSSILNPNRYTITDDETLKRLTGLSKI